MITTSAVLSIGLLSGLCSLSFAQTDNPEAIPVPTAAPPVLNDDRILGVIPNYQTVSDPHAAFTPLTKRQKWLLFFRESTDPYTIATAGLGAAMSQAGNEMPNYGVGRVAFAKRFGAALADETAQSFFSDAVLASVLHEDPRYYRKGPESRVIVRIAYAISRVAVTRTDSGKQTVNWSCLLGTPMGIAVSNAYYPAASVNGSVMVNRLGTSFVGGALGNLLPEFWPDIQKLLHRK